MMRAMMRRYSKAGHFDFLGLAAVLKAVAQIISATALLIIAVSSVFAPSGIINQLFHTFF
jgi:hypothetical protein